MKKSFKLKLEGHPTPRLQPEAKTRVAMAATTGSARLKKETFMEFNLAKSSQDISRTNGRGHWFIFLSGCKISNNAC